MARYTLQLFLGIALTLALQLWHHKHLSADVRERAWNSATWGAAVFWFGPLSMIPWGWVTTCRWWGIVLGVLAAVALFAVILAADALFAWSLGVS